jgi:hypothetical protein
MDNRLGFVAKENCLSHFLYFILYSTNHNSPCVFFPFLIKKKIKKQSNTWLIMIGEV